MRISDKASSQQAQDELVELCLAPKSFGPDGKTYAPDALEQIAERFRALQRGPGLTAATEELLKLSFFLSKKKGAEPAAAQLIAIARTSTPILKAQADRFDGSSD